MNLPEHPMAPRTMRCPMTSFGVTLFILALMALPSAGAASRPGPVEIGVGVEITPTISKPWTMKQIEDVKAVLARDLLGRLRRFPHWDFGLDDASLHQAFVNLAVRDGGPGQVLVGLELGRRSLSPLGTGPTPTTPLPVRLAEQVWLEPGDLEVGFPSPEDATNAIPRILNAVLPAAVQASGNRGLDERELCRRVPIAERPRWLDRPHWILVFPLPRSRYEYLNQAAFTIECRHPMLGTRVQIEARSQGIWGAFDANLTDALSAGVIATNVASDIDEFAPTLIYLKSYDPPDWDVGGF